MTYEQEPNLPEPTIVELLPRYYEANPSNLQYSIDQLFLEEGHEVAWLRYDGTVIFDITDRGQEGSAFSGYTLECACKFIEGVGWRYETELNRTVGLMGAEECDKKDALVNKRLQELRQNYQRTGLLDETTKNTPELIATVILDLIELRKNNDFLEKSNGAHFWGGYFYLQTLQKITNSDWQAIWETVTALYRDKKIRLEGMVVQEYREPYKTPTYGPGEAPTPTIYEEKTDSVWALVPKPDQDVELSTESFEDPANLNLLGRCIIGLAHTRELAEARLQEAISNPRVSYDRAYHQALVAPGYKAGALAVLCYIAFSSEQPEEWVVEAFLGDAVTPEVHTLAMNYSTDYGIDAADTANLEMMMDKWYPR